MTEYEYSPMWMEATTANVIQSAFGKIRRAEVAEKLASYSEVKAAHLSPIELQNLVEKIYLLLDSAEVSVEFPSGRIY